VNTYSDFSGMGVHSMFCAVPREEYEENLWAMDQIVNHMQGGRKLTIQDHVNMHDDGTVSTEHEKGFNALLAWAEEKKEKVNLIVRVDDGANFDPDRSDTKIENYMKTVDYVIKRLTDIGVSFKVVLFNEPAMEAGQGDGNQKYNLEFARWFGPKAVQPISGEYPDVSFIGPAPVYTLCKRKDHLLEYYKLLFGDTTSPNMIAGIHAYFMGDDIDAELWSSIEHLKANGIPRVSGTELGHSFRASAKLISEGLLEDAVLWLVVGKNTAIRFYEYRMEIREDTPMAANLANCISRVSAGVQIESHCVSDPAL
jgi:hypothetical protein